MDNELNKRGYETGSLQKAIKIVESLSIDHPEKSLMELCNDTGMNKSTVFRLIRTLLQKGWLVKNDSNGKYSIGITMFKIGSIALESRHLGEAINKRLFALTDEVKETTHVSVIDDGQLLYVNKVESSQSIRMVSTIGANSPLYCTAMGKALLANMAVDEAMAIIDAVDLKRYTHYTIVNREDLQKELELIRHRGYAIHDGEYEEGVCCIGAPIRDHSGKTIAAISVSGPSYRMKAQGLDRFVEPVMRTARLISQDLGYRDANGHEAEKVATAEGRQAPSNGHVSAPKWAL